MNNNLVDPKVLKKLLVDGQRVLIGVSGGADSMALLHMIMRNRDKFNNTFKVLHVDHQLNPDSAVWAQLVVDYCVEHDMPCEVAKVKVSDWGNNIEQAARLGRYDAFSKQDCDAIMLAHHANDQIETFFLKLFRGSGLKGLRGMSPSSDCWFDQSKKVLRPFLSTTRHEIENYVEDNNIPFVTDPSNIDTKFDRNWIRQCLMPAIQDRNNIADMSILKSIGFQNEAYELLSELAEMDVAACQLSNGDLDWTKAKLLSLPRLKNVIMHICADHNLAGVSTHHIEDFARGLRTADTESRNELRMKNFYMQKVGKRLIINK